MSITKKSHFFFFIPTAVSFFSYCFSDNLQTNKEDVILLETEGVPLEVTRQSTEKVRDKPAIKIKK